MAIAEISAGVSSLKNGLDLIKAMIGLRDAQAFRTKAIELQGIILEAYERAIAAREAQAAEIGRIRELEEEMTRLKAWDAEKKRYKLEGVGSHSAVAYMLKPAERGTEPPHWLCPDCFQRGKPSFLQSPGMNMYICSACKLKFESFSPPVWL